MDLNGVERGDRHDFGLAAANSGAGGGAACPGPDMIRAAFAAGVIRRRRGHQGAHGGAGPEQVVVPAPTDVGPDAAAQHGYTVGNLRQEVRPVPWEAGAPRSSRSEATAAAAVVVVVGEHHAAAVDADRGVGHGDREHLHGAVADEQLGRPVVGAGVAGEVEAVLDVAAGLDAERVRDADVAAAPGAGRTTPRAGACRRGGACWRRR